MNFPGLAVLWNRESYINLFIVLKIRTPNDTHTPTHTHIVKVSFITIILLGVPPQIIIFITVAV